ncbi:hypothetical protein I7I50_04627 [Histoplasma capsulatum G186AR]|uniref:Uncharacterized protein n=1 Tax=Ajellomyces capsulatus TaxID=5037 RepID=A0A8H7YQX6_AJECA|nr:hypothetical protein I7I52_05536 [Histoplasma capsulatum]QSS75481.1 hypothetical protein I7I50_04627 [Histoplasma capsulatum G186AR]
MTIIHPLNILVVDHNCIRFAIRDSSCTKWKTREQHLLEKTLRTKQANTRITSDNCLWSTSNKRLHLNGLLKCDTSVQCLQHILKFLHDSEVINSTCLLAAHDLCNSTKIEIDKAISFWRNLLLHC